MKFAVLYSNKDKAGINIADQLEKHFLPHFTIIELKKESIYSENIDQEEERLKDIDFIIFATKHQSKENRNTLSIHAPGNWRNADLGGRPGKVCKTSALVLKYLFQKLEENKINTDLDYEITLECTHHGPLIEIPCLFIEIGTTEKQWQDPRAGEVIAKTIADLQRFEEWKKENGKNKIAVAIGGPHYCPNFNKIQLSTKSKIAISHIIPEYQLPLTEPILKEAIEKTKEHTNLIVLDWKGLGKSEQKQQILSLIEKQGMISERTEKIEK